MTMHFLREYRWLEPVVDLMRLACFSGFVALVAWNVAGVLRRKDDLVLKRRARALIAYLLAISVTVGLIQIEAWPFTTWALVHTHRTRDMVSWKIEATTRDGRTFEVDPRVLQPLQAEEFGSWMLYRFPTMPAADRDELLRFLLLRANEQRSRFLAGHFPPNDRFLGEASAPAHFRMRRPWRTAADVPNEPFVAIRLWKFAWDTEQRRRDDRAFTRELLWEYRT